MMETGVYELKFNDGRIFRVFTTNKKQKDRLFRFENDEKNGVIELNIITNGIHTIKQFESIMSAESTKKGKP